MRTLSIDIETYSSINLLESGVYRYVESPDFNILLFAYAFDDEEVTVIDLAQGEKLPKHVYEALFDTQVLKTAYNALFERICINTFFNINAPVEQWECTMVKSAMLGMPFGLSKVADVLNLANQKLSIGKALIKYFSCPCKPTKVNGGRTRNFPKHDLEKWNIFKEYCKRDVEVERDIRDRISFFEMPENEKRFWYLDQKINDTGVCLNMKLVKNAIKMNNEYVDKLMAELKGITKLENPNSISQLKTWIYETTGVKIDSLSKEVVPQILEQANNNKVKRALRIRQELSKTSVKKYESMNEVICNDGKVRGLLQFYGANRTGRWAGRLIQIHNLPKNKIKDLELARQTVLEGDLDMLEILYGNVPNILSQLIRTTFIASENGRFIVADFSAIEARVISWLAGEKWKLDVFNTHGKIYEAAASQMFHVPIENIDKGSPLRQKGKVAELALGYQGGVGALIKMGALNMGIEEDELQEIVDKWRSANPRIVNLWKIVGKAAIKTVKEKVPITVQYGITCYYRKGFLFIRLPSGRNLAYMRATIREGKFGDELTYQGINQMSKKFERIPTYGGKLVENIVQAIARDCLAETLLKLDKAGYKTVMHVHDEVILDTPFDSKLGIKKALDIMGEPIKWAPGLPLKGDGYETEYYLKD